MATSLLDWIIDLMRDGDAREAFNSNPQAAMASAGFTNVCGGDVQHAIIDEPSIREVQGASLPAPSTAPDIRYIVNNYTVQPGDVTTTGVPSDTTAATDTTDTTTTTTGTNVLSNPGDNGPIVHDIGDGNTIDQTQADTTTQTSTDDHTTTDNSTDDHTSTAAHNIVAGDGSAGQDQIQDSTLSAVNGASGDGSTNILNLTDVVDTGNVHVLSDLVNGDVLDHSLNHSPIADDLLHDGVNDSLNNLVHNLL